MRYILKHRPRQFLHVYLWNRISCKNMSIRLFEGEEHAKLYAKYRPTYPDEVYSVIYKFCQSPVSSGCDVALDIGCGNGQSTLPLSKYFKKVIGMDISQNQITEARKLTSDVEFRVGKAEDLSFQGDDTVDLVTTAQAIHWMDRDQFYKEVSRVMKPGGALVVYGYGNFTLDNDHAQKIINEFYHNTLDDFWTKQRHHIDDCLARIELPYKGWTRDDSLSIKRTWDVEAFLGYLSSWSAWQAYLKSHPGSSVLKDIGQRMKTLYTTDESSREVMPMKLTWPVFMLMGRKPKY